MSKPSINRVLKCKETLNVEKIYVEMSRTGNKMTVKFYEHGKQNRQPKNPYHEAIYDLLKKWYSSIDFDYPNFNDHKGSAIKLFEKIEGSMKRKAPEAEFTEEDVLMGAELFLSQVPKWYIDTGNITVNQLIKLYPQIIQTIKTKAKNGYTTARNQEHDIDFSDIVEGGK